MRRWAGIHVHRDTRLLRYSWKKQRVCRVPRGDALQRVRQSTAYHAIEAGPAGEQRATVRPAGRVHGDVVDTPHTLEAFVSRQAGEISQGVRCTGNDD